MTNSQFQISRNFKNSKCPQITIHTKLINSVFIFTNVLTLLANSNPTQNNINLAKYLLNSINQCSYSSCSCSL